MEHRRWSLMLRWSMAWSPAALVELQWNIAGGSSLLQWSIDGPSIMSRVLHSSGGKGCVATPAAATDCRIIASASSSNAASQHRQPPVGRIAAQRHECCIPAPMRVALQHWQLMTTDGSQRRQHRRTLHRTTGGHQRVLHL